MADFVLRVGSRSAQGIRPNNEDRYHVDLQQRLFVVADGMGGQERGELASGMAVDIIPKVVHDCLCQQAPAERALAESFQQANEAIIDAGKSQPFGRMTSTPRSNKYAPVTKQPDADTAWAEVAGAVRKVLEGLKAPSVT